MPKRQAAVAADNKRKKAKTGDSYEIEKFKLSWSMVGSTDSNGVGQMILLHGDLPGRNKVAAFDIDFTIIKTKSGRNFPTGPKDWVWLYSCVPEKLKKLHDDGYRIIFFTNQAGIEKQKTSPQEVMTKVNDMIETLDIPIFTFVCTGMNHYRKPSTFMWDHFVKSCNQGISLNLSDCIYVGDAAGRAKGWQKDKPKDFSCGDRKFAANIGIGFKTPEEYFHNEAAAPFQWGSLDPVTYLNNIKSNKNSKTTDNIQYHTKTQEMVLMVGAPASGKSTFSKKNFVDHGYVSVNRDTLHTPAKCLKVAQEAVNDKKSVVIDNTSPSSKVREDYIKIAKAAGIPCRCFILQTSPDLTQHLNMYRQNLTNGRVRRIPGVAYNMFKKNYEEPNLKEGFKEIKKIDFVPEFKSKREELLFKQWTNSER